MTNIELPDTHMDLEIRCTGGRPTLVSALKKVTEMARVGRSSGDTVEKTPTGPAYIKFHFFKPVRVSTVDFTRNDKEVDGRD